MALMVTPERVILRVLQEAGRQLKRPVTRTELVKLVYLVDFMYAQHSEGRTLTGLNYFWDNHGPNSLGNEIVKRADIMELWEGTIQSYEALTSGGNSKFLYKVDPETPFRPIDNQLAENIIEDVVGRYGPLGWKGMTAFAKQTRPMRGIRQGELLDLSPLPRTTEVLGRIREKAESGGYDGSRRRVSLAELKKRGRRAG